MTGRRIAYAYRPDAALHTHTAMISIIAFGNSGLCCKENVWSGFHNRQRAAQTAV